VQTEFNLGFAVAHPADLGGRTVLLGAWNDQPSTAPLTAIDPGDCSIIKTYGSLPFTTLGFDEDPDTGHLIVADYDEGQMHDAGSAPYVVTAGSFVTFSISAQPVDISLEAKPPPNAPSNVRGGPGNAGANLAWNAPPSNGYPVTGYVVTPYLNGARQAPTTFTTASTAGRVGGLTNGATYTFTVAAFNHYGTGPPSTPSAGILIGAPASPVSVRVAPGNGSVSLSWIAGNDMGSPITGYVVTPYQRATPLAKRVFNSTATTATITGLINGTPYHFKVAAINARGVGPVSAASPTIIAGTPTAPVALTASTGVGSSALHWSAPTSDNGNAITAYVVIPFRAGVAQLARTFNSTATTQTVTGLSPGSYTFRVFAQNVYGIGGGSGYSSAVTIT